MGRRQSGQDDIARPVLSTSKSYASRTVRLPVVVVVVVWWYGGGGHPGQRGTHQMRLTRENPHGAGPHGARYWCGAVD